MPKERLQERKPLKEKMLTVHLLPLFSLAEHLKQKEGCGHGHPRTQQEAVTQPHGGGRSNFGRQLRRGTLSREGDMII